MKLLILSCMIVVFIQALPYGRHHNLVKREISGDDSLSGIGDGQDIVIQVRQEVNGCCKSRCSGGCQHDCDGQATSAQP